jgi:hypothetical protein
VTFKGICGKSFHLIQQIFIDPFLGESFLQETFRKPPPQKKILPYQVITCKVISGLNKIYSLIYQEEKLL